jgi:nicotinamide-nucleotide amidase
MLAEVISIGDELTTGQRLDTNSQWLSERLTELGVRVGFHTTVADDLEANIAVFRAAADRADVVVATGGLGPTADDLTREALAAMRGVELVQDEEALEHIRKLFASRGRSMPERNVVQALFPRGSRPIRNPLGTAPGIEMACERSGKPACRVFALPGVPAEMFAMWHESVAPVIARLFSQRRTIRHRRIKCFGTGESHLEAMLPDLIRRGREPSVGITVSGATITLRITASGSDEHECLALMQPTIGQIYDSLGALVFGEEEDELEHAVVRLLRERRMTVSVVEWSTGGLVSGWLAAADQAGDCFLGGLTAAGEPAIRRMFPDLSSPSAADLSVELAKQMRRKTKSDFGLAIGRSEASAERIDPVVTIGLASETGVKTKEISQFADPELARLRTAKSALDMLRLTLLGAYSGEK